MVSKSSFYIIIFLLSTLSVASNPLDPDIVVAQDGSGDFATINEAVASLEINNRHRVVILIKNGVYTEQVRIFRSNVTIRGESRKGTRIEFSSPRRYHNDSLPPLPDRGVVNVHGDGIILKDLTIENTYPFRRHTFALFGRGTKIITINCDIIAQGNDTVALWARGGGMYYHSRCYFQGNIDFLCPRGWCYVDSTTFYEVDTRAVLWHDGGKDPRKKLVVKNSIFKGDKEHALGRYPRDSQFYLLGCQFSDRTQDVLDNNAPDHPTDDFRWGRRVFFYDCHTESGDRPWHADNLKEAPGSPAIDELTPSWTYEGKWDPERKDSPVIQKVSVELPHRIVKVVFSEEVTVRGKPYILTKAGDTLRWSEKNNSKELIFAKLEDQDEPLRLELNSGSIFATSPSCEPRFADLTMPD